MVRARCLAEPKLTLNDIPDDRPRIIYAPRQPARNVVYLMVPLWTGHSYLVIQAKVALTVSTTLISSTNCLYWASFMETYAHSERDEYYQSKIFSNFVGRRRHHNKPRSARMHTQNKERGEKPHFSSLDLPFTSGSL